MTEKKFVFDVSWVFVSQVITLIINLAFYVILGRYLGPGPLGLYSLTLTISTILGTVAGVGIPTAITKFVAERNEDEEELNSYIYPSIINTAILGIIVGLCLFIFSGFIADIYNQPDLKLLLQLISIYIPFLVVNNTLLGIFNGLRKMRSYTLRTVFRAVLLISFTILFLLSGLGVTGVVLALVIAEISTFLLMLMFSLHYFTFSLDNYTQHSKIILKFSSYLLVSSLLYILITNVEILLLGYFLDDDAVGIFSIANYASGLLMMIPNAIAIVTYPSISSFHKVKNKLIIQNLIQRSMRFCMFALSSLGLLMVLFAKPVILLFLGPKFLPAITPLAILTIAVIFHGGLASVGSSWTAMDRPDLNYKLQIVYLIIALAIYIPIIPILGITGAALGAASVTIMGVFVAFYVYRRSLDIKLEAKKYLLAGIITGLLIAAFLIMQEFINLYLLIPLLIAIYLIITVKLILTTEDLQNIKLLIKTRSLKVLFENNNQSN